MEKAFKLVMVALLVMVLMLVGLPSDRMVISDVAAQIKTRFGSVQIDHDLNVDGTFTAAGGSTFTNLDLNGTTLTIDADADTTLASVSDDTPILTLGAGTGVFNIATGNLKVGNGTPTLTQNGEDGYIEGTFEVDGQTQLDGGLDLNGSTLTIDTDADTTLVAGVDDIITLTLGAAAGRVDLLTGNLAIGNGTPDVAQDGEDLYVEGTSEFDGVADFDAGLTFGPTPLYPLGISVASQQIECGITALFTATTLITSTTLNTPTYLIALQVTAPVTTAAYLHVTNPTTTAVVLNSLTQVFEPGTTGVQAHYCMVGTE